MTTIDFDFNILFKICQKKWIFQSKIASDLYHEDMIFGSPFTRGA